MKFDKKYLLINHCIFLTFMSSGRFKYVSHKKRIWMLREAHLILWVV